MAKRKAEYELIQPSYGKQSVPVFKVRKAGLCDEVVDLHVQVLLEGDVEASWVEGDNRQILPTDTLKNTCYINALKHEYSCGEEYGLALAHDILARHSHLHRIRLEIEEHRWERLMVGGKPHNHVFTKPRDSHKLTCAIDVLRDGPERVTSGVRDLCLMKTRQSGFEGFIVDEYTTLQPVGPQSERPDRILCNNFTASWTYEASATSIDAERPKFVEVNAQIFNAMLEEWAGPAEVGVFSKSIQQTAYLMAKRALDEVTLIEEVTLTNRGNQHYPLNLKAFDLANPNIVFQSTECHSSASGHTITRLRRKTQ